ncbi:YkvI family membrane protein [Syntrophomonas curvata]
MTENKKAAATSASIAFGMAAVWFGTHCGGGFATGNQEVNFYVQYGWYAIPLGILAMLLLGYCHRNGLIFAKDNKTYDYKSYANALFHPYEKIFSPIFEIGYIILILCGVSAAVAGGAALLSKTTGIPYGLAIVIIGAILLVMTIFGSKLIIAASKYMTYFLLVAVGLTFFLGIKAGWVNFTHIMAARDTFGTSFGPALWKALVYVGFQSFTLMPIISCAQDVRSTKECNTFFGYGFAMNAIMLLLACVMLLGFSPQVLKETLPVHFVATSLGYSWMLAIYSLVLFIALVSTAVTLVFSMVARFENVWQPSSGIFENLRARRIAISILTTVICTSISIFGLTAIVVKGYGSVGYLGLLIVVIPGIFVAGYKNRKATELRAANGIDESDSIPA